MNVTAQNKTEIYAGWFVRILDQDFLLMWVGVEFSCFYSMPQSKGVVSRPTRYTSRFLEYLSVNLGLSISR